MPLYALPLIFPYGSYIGKPLQKSPLKKCVMHLQGAYGHRCPADQREFFIKIFGPAPYQGGLEKEIMKNLADKALTMGGYESH